MSIAKVMPKAGPLPMVKAADKTPNTSLSERVSSLVMSPFNALSSLYDTLCPYNSLTESRQLRIFPQWLEVAIGGYGYRSYIDKEGGEWDDPKYPKMAERIFKRMTPLSGRPDLPWHVKVFDSSVVDAWSKMGGYTAMSSAIIERAVKEKKTYGLGHIDEQSKIAAVQAHEIAHVSARHIARWLEVTALLNILLFPVMEFIEEFLLLDTLLWSSYSRSQEFEADKLGMKLMHKAGYDPKAAIWIQHFLKDYEASYGIGWMDWLDRWLWGHPDADQRIAANKITLAELKKRPQTAAAAA